MSFLLNRRLDDFARELDFDQLLAVNGGCGGSFSGDSGYTGGSGENHGYNSYGSSGSGSSSSGSGSCSGTGSYNIGSSSSSSSGTCSGTNTNTSQSDSIADSINNHSNESYVKGENDCDIWVQNVLQDAGYDISDEWGDAANYSVDDHEQLLEGKTSNTPDAGWNVVLMTDHKSTNNYISHSALIEVNSDGSCTLYQHSSSSPSVENYSSVGAFQNAYGYNDFDYYNIRQ